MRPVEPATPGAPSIRRNASLFILGVFVALALFVENAMNGASGVYLTNVVEANPSIPVMAFGAFQPTTAIGDSTRRYWQDGTRPSGLQTQAPPVSTW